MARDNMTLEEVIQFTKQALENVNTDKRVSTEFRFAAWQVKRLLVWLEDYKRLKDEMIPAYDEQLIEAQCKVVQQMREMKQLKADYIDLDHRLRTANTENDELKRMLSLALESFDFISDKLIPYTGSMRICDFAMLRANPFDNCFNCPLSNAKHKYCKWKHYDEAMELLGGTDNA